MRSTIESILFKTVSRNCKRNWARFSRQARSNSVELVWPVRKQSTAAQGQLTEFQRSVHPLRDFLKPKKPFPYGKLTPVTEQLMG